MMALVGIEPCPFLHHRICFGSLMLVASYEAYQLVYALEGRVRHADVLSSIDLALVGIDPYQYRRAFLSDIAYGWYHRASAYLYAKQVHLWCHPVSETVLCDVDVGPDHAWITKHQYVGTKDMLASSTSWNLINRCQCCCESRHGLQLPGAWLHALGMPQITVYLIDAQWIIPCQLEMPVNIAGHHEIILAMVHQCLEQLVVTVVWFVMAVGDHPAYVKVP